MDIFDEEGDEVLSFVHINESIPCQEEYKDASYEQSELTLTLADEQKCARESSVNRKTSPIPLDKQGEYSVFER